MRLFIIKVYLIFLTVGLWENIPVFAQGMMEQGHQVVAQEIEKGRPSAQAAAGAPEVAKAVVATPALAPTMEIKRLEGEKPLYSFELRDVEVKDLFRVLAHDYKLNLLIDKDVEGKITASLTNVSLEEVLETIAESQNIILEKKGNIVKVTPNLITKTFTLKHIEAKKLLESLVDRVGAGAGGAVSAAGGAEAGGVKAGASAGQEAGGATSTKQVSTIYDLLSDKGKILLGKQPNSLMVIDYPSNIKKIEDYLKAIDWKMTSRVFKLKYLKAADVVGQTSTAQGQPASAIPESNIPSSAAAGSQSQ